MSERTNEAVVVEGYGLRTLLTMLLTVGGCFLVGWWLLSDPHAGSGPCEPILGEMDEEWGGGDSSDGCGVERDRRLAGVAILVPVTMALARRAGRGISRWVAANPGGQWSERQVESAGGPGKVTVRTRPRPKVEESAPEDQAGGSDPPSAGHDGGR